MFYGLRLLSTIRAFGVDCLVELVGVSLKEGGVTGSLTGEENGLAPREAARQLVGHENVLV